MFRFCSLCFAFLLCHMEYLQPMLPRILDGIPLREVADTGLAVVYHVAAAFVHTAQVIMLRETDHFIGGVVNPLMPLLLLRAPPHGLVTARYNNYQADVSILLALVNYGLRREAIKSPKRRQHSTL